MRFHSVTDVYLFHKEIGIHAAFGSIQSRDYKPLEVELKNFKTIRGQSKHVFKPSMDFGFSMFKSCMGDKPFVKELALSILDSDSIRLSKAIFSLQTHLMIEFDFYHSELDQLSFERFCLYTLKKLKDIPVGLMEGSLKLDVETASLLLSFVPEDMMRNVYCAAHKIEDKTFYDMLYSNTENDLQGKFLSDTFSCGQVMAMFIKSDLFDFKT